MNTSEIVKFNKRSGNDTERYINLSQSIQEGIFLVIQFKDEIKNFKSKLEEQRRFIWQYESWISSLIELLENTEYSEYSSQIMNVFYI